MVSKYSIWVKLLQLSLLYRNKKETLPHYIIKLTLLKTDEFQFL